jgi:ABC-2 type transport system ATP-binding protein
VTRVLEINGLRKTYRKLIGAPRQALDGFDMVVERGEIHGFLGPNGSGKTTTLRTLLGLIRANDGQMRLLGQPVPDALPTVIRSVGAIVESPQFFPHFSGRRTLSLLARAGGIPQTRVDAVLEIVGLRDRAKERVKTYSLGMKQRLAVASALLKSPELLILDEPANGLDPGGIREMRDLMRNLVAGGCTVILSSHILGEVQLICDSVTIISQGRRVAAGPVSDVLKAQDRGEFRVRLADLAAGAQTLTAIGARVRPEHDCLVVAGISDAAQISQALGSRQLWLTELTPISPDLETVFLELTGTASAPGQHRQVDQSLPVGLSVPGPGGPGVPGAGPVGAPVGTTGVGVSA